MAHGPMMRLPSSLANQHNFALVPNAEIPRSTFDRSFKRKSTFDAGYLIPFYRDLAIPGDTFSLTPEFFARLATPIKPVMDNLWLDWFFFAIPIRLVWDNFVKMMGEQRNPGDSTSYIVPIMTAHIPAVGSLSDYLGLPTAGQVTTAIPHSSLWHRGYNLVYNEFFRDQNLINSAVVDVDDGPDTITDYVLRRRGKRHDYFTSCLPSPQKGTAVALPIGTSAPVRADTGADTALGAVSGTLGGVRFLRADVTNQRLEFEAGAGGAALFADLSATTGATIAQLRQAFQVQRMLERDARGGTRYIEKIKAHFGVTSPDARLQRPEYLGGGSAPIIISPIAQTSAENATEPTPQGNLAAIGTVSAHGSGFTKSFTEHTLLLGMCSVRADYTYYQGTPRDFLLSTVLDFPWPALAHLGEEAVLSREIFTDGGANDANVFGYQERYAWCRYKPSEIVGQFRGTAAVNFDIWHLAQEFSPRPTLGQTFIEEDPPIDRVIATPTEPHLIMDSYMKLICARPLPVFGVPGLIDHF